MLLVLRLEEKFGDQIENHHVFFFLLKHLWGFSSSYSETKDTSLNLLMGSNQLNMEYYI